MPQMMPLNWLTLMMFFMICFFFFNNLNYWNFLYTKKISESTKYSHKLNWKW